MKYFSILIKPASSICNMKCKYCFYYDVADHREIRNYGIMNENTMKVMIDQILSYFQEEVVITYSFQGGEPTCAGLEYFKCFVEYVEDKKNSYHHIQYAIQTNGLLIDDEWLSFLKENHFLVGISIDGSKTYHDEVRVDGTLKGSHERVVNVIDRMEKMGIEFNVLTVLTAQLAQHPKELFEFYLENKMDYIQLIPCLPPLEVKNDYYALTPQAFFDFYDVFFSLWLKEYEKDHIISVSHFDNLISLFADKPPLMCGYLGFCSMQFVVESNGDVYPCDFFVLDQYRIGNIKENSIEALAKSQVTGLFLQEEKRNSKLCGYCRYIKICNGQCKRMNICYYDDEYCGLQAFMQKYEKEIMDIAQRVQ